MHSWHVWQAAEPLNELEDFSAFDSVLANMGQSAGMSDIETCSPATAATAWL